MNKFQLRDYQLQPFNEILFNLQTGINTVLAAGTGAGKTVIAAFLADVLVKQNKKVLILTHGQTVLKTQWTERLDQMQIPYSTNCKNYTNLLVGLPQSIKNIEKISFDYIIIDEAHEFYFAEKMVQSIIKKAKPKAILCLTATPSKFISRGGFDVKVIAALDLYKQGYLADLYFGLFSTPVKFKKIDYNSDNNLKTTFEFKNSQTKDALHSMLDEMHRRITTVFNKSNPHVYKVTKKFVNVLGKLEKTLIACHSISQAEFVKNFLEEQNVKVCLSNSDNDVDSHEIERFKNNKDILVLIVVNRGILGFDFSELVNVVDMTGTMNIDRMFQMYGRVLRKDENNPNKEKFYFKLAPENELEVHRIYLQAAIHLMEHSFVSRYNGKNLEEMEICVLREKVAKNNTKKESKPPTAGKIKSIDSFFLDSICAQDIFINLWTKKGTPLDEVSYTKMSIILGKINKVEVNLHHIYGTDIKKITKAIQQFKSIEDWRESL
jgi:superfamily II DNA or RNA helicase